MEARTNGDGRHGASFAGTAVTPDAVAASLARGDGGFGRAQERYYEHPILRKAHWRWEIVSYFFVGGMSAASGLLATAARNADEDDLAETSLARNGSYTALAGALASGVLLILDLGRPERFLNMLRIVKIKSPMSVGVYSLMAFSGAATFAASEWAARDGILPFDPFGWLPRPLRDALMLAGAPMMMCYTGVLVSATAIPVWYRGRRHIPAIFACSAMSTACALQAALLALGGGNARAAARLERIEALAAVAEGVLLLDYERRGGEPAQALFGGHIGARLKTWTLGAGIAGTLLLAAPSLLRPRHEGKPNAARTLLASALTLAGGYVLRAAVIEAGRTSADDPRAYLRHPE